MADTNLTQSSEQFQQNASGQPGGGDIQWQQLILDSADLTIISTNTEGLILTFNAGASHKLGYTPDEVVGKVAPTLLHDPDEVARRAQALSGELGRPIEPGFEVFTAKARLGQTDENEWTYIRKDGTRFPVSLTVTTLRDAKGEIVGFVGIGKDISQQQQAEQTLRDSESRFRQLTEAAFEGIALLREGIVIDANGPFCRLFGYSLSEVMGKTAMEFVAPRYRAQVQGKIRQGDETLYESLGLRKDGTTFPIEVCGRTTHLSQGPMRVAAIRDITERKRFEQQLLEQQQQLEAANTQLEAANARLVQLSRTDALTGLCNRRAFEESFKSEFDRACRQQTPLSLIAMDLDAFKSYNDGFGHPAGDEVLQEVARILSHLARNTDIVARVGGEEFAIILPATDGPGAHISAERFRRGLEETTWPNRQVTASFGVATVHPLYTNRDYGAVIQAADKALYQSKQNGRNRVT